MSTNSFTITYGGFAVGGSSAGYKLDGPHAVNLDYETGAVSFSVIVLGDSEADFASKCGAIEAAFRKPWQDLVVKLGTTTILSLSHGSNTGFKGEPSIVKSGDPGDTGLSRVYDIAIQFGLPADLSGQAARRNASVRLGFNPARRLSVTFTGEYTALGGSSAYAAYLSGFAAWSGAVLTTLGGTYDLMSENVNQDDPNKVVSFEVSYLQVIADEGPSGFVQAGVRDANLSISTSQPFPGDGGAWNPPNQFLSGGGQVLRPVDVRATVEMWVVPAEQDPFPALAASYKDWLIQKISEQIGGGGIVVVDSGFTPYPNEGRFSAFVSAQVYQSGLIRYNAEISFRDSSGTVILPAPNPRDGPLAAYTFQGPQEIYRIMNEVSVTQSGAGRAGASPGAGAGLEGFFDIVADAQAEAEAAADEFLFLDTSDLSPGWWNNYESPGEDGGGPAGSDSEGGDRPNVQIPSSPLASPLESDFDPSSYFGVGSPLPKNAKWARAQSEVKSVPVVIGEPGYSTTATRTTRTIVHRGVVPIEVDAPVSSYNGQSNAG